MKSLNKWVIISAVTSLIYNIVSANRIDCKIHKLIQEIDPYQTIIFISNIVAQDPIFNKTLTIPQLPIVINSFKIRYDDLYFNDIRMHKSIQTSLIIFYASDFYEIG